MKNARPKDLQEVKIVSGLKKIRLSDFGKCDIIIDDITNEVYGVGGVEELEGMNGVWLLCTHKVEEHPVKFLRFIKKYNDTLTTKYNPTWNIAWLGNDLHIRWLKWMGAKFLDNVVKINGEKFQRFEFRKE